MTQPCTPPTTHRSLPPRGHRESRNARLLGVLLSMLLVLFLAGCGSAQGQGGTGTDDSAGDHSADRPEAVISLSATATETLFALGAGDQVIAVDDQSDYPEDAPRTELSGYTPNVEAILGYGPDLVLVSDRDEDLVASLERAGVEVLVLPAATDFEDAYDQVERIGEATGRTTEAETLVGQMRAGIETAVEQAPDASGMTYFHELDPSLFTVSGETFIGQVYGLFGLENIADAAADGDDYPKLSAEYVVDADPDLVFLSDAQCCDVTPESVAERAAWQDMTAVREGRIHVLDEDVASRWGPRVVDFVEDVAEILRDLTLE